MAGIIRQARLDAGMSMPEAATRLERLARAGTDIVPMSAERIGRIERSEESAQADEIYSLSVAYDAPSLLYKYCCGVCGLGRKIVPSVSKKASLGDATIALLGSVREFEETEKRLTVIASDGRVDCLERAEFERIITLLDRIAGDIQSLKFWAATHVKD